MAQTVITAALTRLSPADQEVLRLAAWEQLDTAALAYVLECSEVAARVRLHRATRRLQQVVLLHRAGPAPGDGWFFDELRPVSMVAAASIAAVSAVAIAADVVTWPWWRGGAESIAYGVTQQGGGSVEVRAHWADIKDPSALQAQLRAAGVPVVVLVESPSGVCNEPLRDGNGSGTDLIGAQSQVNL